MDAKKEKAGFGCVTLKNADEQAGAAMQGERNWPSRCGGFREATCLLSGRHSDIMANKTESCDTKKRCATESCLIQKKQDGQNAARRPIEAVEVFFHESCKVFKRVSIVHLNTSGLQRH